MTEKIVTVIELAAPLTAFLALFGLYALDLSDLVTVHVNVSGATETAVNVHQVLSWLWFVGSVACVGIMTAATLIESLKD